MPPAPATPLSSMVVEAVPKSNGDGVVHHAIVVRPGEPDLDVTADARPRGDVHSIGQAHSMLDDASAVEDASLTHHRLT